jgi:hypothetical protein
MNTASTFFDVLDQRIEELLNVDHAENDLIELFSNLATTIQSRAGTAAGISGLSEYIFFRFIKRSLERRTGSLFQGEKHGVPYIFRNKDLLLTHDIDISKFEIGVNKQRTDIAVFSFRADRCYRLLAAFELKVYLTDRQVVDDMVGRFDNLAEKTTALLFPVMFQGGYAKELEEFCSHHPGRAFVIANVDHKFKMSINQVIDIIVAMMSK